MSMVSCELYHLKMFCTYREAVRLFQEKLYRMGLGFDHYFVNEQWNEFVEELYEDRLIAKIELEEWKLPEYTLEEWYDLLPKGKAKTII